MSTGTPVADASSQGDCETGRLRVRLRLVVLGGVGRVVEVTHPERPPVGLCESST